MTRQTRRLDFPTLSQPSLFDVPTPAPSCVPTCLPLPGRPLPTSQVLPSPAQPDTPSRPSTWRPNLDIPNPAPEPAPPVTTAHTLPSRNDIPFPPPSSRHDKPALFYPLRQADPHPGQHRPPPSPTSRPSPRTPQAVADVPIHAQVAPITDKPCRHFTCPTAPTGQPLPRHHPPRLCDTPTRPHRSDIPAPSISERHTAPCAAPPTPIGPTFLTGSQTGPARRPSAAPSPSSVTYLTVPFPSQALRRPSPPRSRAVPPLADRSPLPRTTPI